MTQPRGVRAMRAGLVNQLLTKKELHRGLQLWCRGDFVGAEAVFRLGLKTAPENLVADLQVALAATLTATARYPEAVELFDAALPHVRGQQRGLAMVNAGICRSMLGDLPAALLLWEAVVAEGHPLPAAYAHARLGEELLRAGEVAAALPHLAAAMASSQPEPRACAKANLGHIYALNNKLVKAHDLWESARRSEFLSASTQADFYAAVQLAKEGNLVAAKELLNSVVERGYPDSAADARKQLQIIEDSEQP